MRVKFVMMRSDVKCPLCKVSELSLPVREDGAAVGGYMLCENCGEEFDRMGQELIHIRSERVYPLGLS